MTYASGGTLFVTDQVSTNTPAGANGGTYWGGATYSSVVVSSGATLNGGTTFSGGSVQVSNAGNLSSVTIANGGVIVAAGLAYLNGTIADAGSLTGGVLVNNAKINVTGSGSLTGTQVYGTVSAAPGTTLSNVTAANDGMGTSGTVTASGASLTGTFTNFGTLNGGTLVSGALLYAGGAYGNVNGLTVSGGTAVFKAGGAGSNITLSGGSLEFQSGSIPKNIAFGRGGGVVQVDSGLAWGGNGSAAYGPQSGGTLLITSGASVSNVVVNQGGTLAVQPYATINGPIYNSGVLSGGALTAGNTIWVQGSGQLIQTLAYGTINAASGTTLSNFALVNNSSGTSGVANASGARLDGRIVNQGTINGGTLVSGAVLSAGGPYGILNNVTISGGAALVQSGGAASNMTLNGGSLEFQSGSTPNNIAFGSGGGLVQVDSGIAWGGNGSAAYGPQSGGTLLIMSGASVSNVVVNQGGTLAVQPSATINGPIYNSGVLSGGALTAGNTIWVQGSGQLIQTVAYGTINAASGTTLSNFALVNNSSGTSGVANASGARLDGRIVNQGTINGGTLVSGAFLSAGGPYGILNNTTISGGSVLVQSGGAANNTSLNGGSIEFASGTTPGLVTFGGGGGTVRIDSSVTWNGNAAAASAVRSGGTLLISSGGTASSAVVSAGGTMALQSGGLITGTTYNQGGVVSGGSQAAGTILYVQGQGVLAQTSISGTVSAVSGTMLSGIRVTNNGAGVSGTVYAGGASLIGTIVNQGAISGGTLASGATLSTGSPYGYVTGLTVSGGSVLVQSGGGADKTTLNGGSIEFASGTVPGSVSFSSGGGVVRIDSSVTWSGNNNPANGPASGGTLVVSSGASAVNTIVNSGGTLTMLSGAGGIYNVLQDGGHIVVGNSYNNQHQTSLNVGSQSVIRVISGGTLYNGDISKGGTISVDSAGVANGISISSGGTMAVQSGGTIGTSGIVVSAGGTAILNGPAGSGPIYLPGDGAKLVISGTQMPTNPISAFTTDDAIDLSSISLRSVKSVSRTATGVVITTNDNQSYTLGVTDASSYGYQLVDDGNGGTIYTTCFAEGTRIRMIDGDSTVETIVCGDIVMTPEGPRPVRWIGRRHLVVSRQPRPEESWLIRIRKDALADGVPSRDLLVTQEHCMMFSGYLVPARMLVNDVSIVVDRTIPAYTYHHVELDEHLPIWAEDALTESYLDTGNRSQFEDPDSAFLSGSGIRNSGASALEVNTQRSFVEPLYRDLLSRSGGSGRAPDLTDEADIHLLTEDGREIPVTREKNSYHMFMIPDDVDHIVIASRTARPADVVGPFVDDRRELGISVGTIQQYSAHGTSFIDEHLVDPDLPGWDMLENDGFRWTNGRARLPLGSSALGGGRVLAVQILAKGPYPAQILASV